MDCQGAPKGQEALRTETLNCRIQGTVPWGLSIRSFLKLPDLHLPSRGGSCKTELPAPLPRLDLSLPHCGLAPQKNCSSCWLQTKPLPKVSPLTGEPMIGRTISLDLFCRKFKSQVSGYLGSTSYFCSLSLNFLICKMEENNTSVGKVGLQLCVLKIRVYLLIIALFPI